MRSLESRIEKLEAETGAAVLTVILRSFDDGELSALEDVRGGQTFKRDPGEAEEAFLDRAQASSHAFPADGCSMSVLREIRA
jgi:hypothetical protein